MALHFSFDYADGSMPRTVYYERLVEALKGLPGYRDNPSGCALVFPEGDTTLETNWPRYARPETAFIRGTFDRGRHDQYLDRLAQAKSPLCIVNMHPFIRVPQLMLGNPNIVVADINLRDWERSLAPRSISMPALPVTVGQYKPEIKRIMAGFRGVDSHPCRRALAALHNGKTIIAELVDKTNHFGKLDAEKGVIDPTYVALMEASIFAFIPRGDAEFSYRLLEAMSFGCIPIILADGLVLPFDRIVPWEEFSLHMPESRISEIPGFLARMPAHRISAMQGSVYRVYRQYFAGIQQIAAGLIEEVRIGLNQPVAAPINTTPHCVSTALSEEIGALLPKPEEKARRRTGPVWDIARRVKRHLVR